VRRFGTTCGLSPYRWQGEGPPPGPGAYIRSSGGSVYEVLEAHAIAGNPNNLRLKCVRTDPDQVPAGTRFYLLVWDKRARTKRTR